MDGNTVDPQALFGIMSSTEILQQVLTNRKMYLLESVKMTTFLYKQITSYVHIPVFLDSWPDFLGQKILQINKQFLTGPDPADHINFRFIGKMKTG